MSRQIANALRAVDGGANSAAAIVMLTCVLMVRPAAAQDASDPQSLVPGLRVRIAAPDVAPGKVVGTIDKVDKDSVTIDVPGRQQPIDVPRDKIMNVDVSEGPRSRWVDVGIGAGAGAAAGAVTCVVANDKSRSGFVNISDGVAAGVCGLLGAALGAVIGAAIPPGERWRPMAASGYRISLVPRLDHELGFAVSMAF